MRKNPAILFGYLVIFVFWIISCSGTQLTQKKVDKVYKGPPISDILVIAVTGNEANRRSFEKKFVAQLKSVGVDAISSEEAIPMPPDLELKKETILNAVNKFENDAVIITHLMGKEEKEVFTRGGAGSRELYGFYHRRYSYAHDSGYSSTSTTVLLETNLYDAKTEKLIWSGRSKSWNKDSKGQIVNDVIKAVINDLQKNKLIAPKN